jgi:hypothetical protein
MRALERDHLDVILRPSPHIRNPMDTVFFKVSGIDFVKNLPEWQKITPEYFKDENLYAIYRGSLGDWRPGHPTHLTSHFKKEPVHSATGVVKTLIEYGFFLLAHSSYSPDLSSYDFFIFGHLRQQLQHTRRARRCHCLHDGGRS